MNIILIDDDKLVCSALKTILESDPDFHVPVMGHDGTEAISLYTKYRPDLILMDIRMPIMNGYETTQAIRGLERSDAQAIPIIAMTADAFSEDIQQCLECGMNAHTAKPINLDEVLSLLKKHIL